MPYRLTHRADRIELPAGDSEWHTIINAESPVAGWRLIELSALRGGPYEAQLSWSAGAGTGPTARITVPRGARVCVFARAIQIRVANRSASETLAAVAIADAALPTRNTLEHTGTIDAGGYLDVDVPPFADRYVVQFSDPGAVPGSVIEVYDGHGTQRASIAVQDQQLDGIPVGGADSIRIRPASAVKLRGIWFLSL